ncbi:MAG TPA: penicillin-binding protein 2 [bacterium]|nr:penicillin-binding protein 2 [bacterium]
MDRDVFERRLTTLAVLAAVMLVVLVIRLWQVQIVQGDYYLKLSEENRLRVTPVLAPRGVLVDRRGRTLVANRPAFTVALLPLELRHPRAEAQAVGKLLAMDPAEILSRLAAGRDRPFEPVRLRRDVPKEIIAAIEESQLDLPGVLVEVEPLRQYVYRTLGAQIFGYVGEINEDELKRLRPAGYELGDLIGKEGIEETYDAYIRGRNGQIQAEVDAQGRMVRTLGTVPAVPGNEVVLGLDLAMQQVAEAGLGDRPGVVVAMDPRDGTILTMVSHPAFDPNVFSGGIKTGVWNGLIKDPARPLLDRVIQGAYPPGSVFKVVTASTALQLGLVTPDTGFYSPGYYNLGNWTFHAWKALGHVNFIDAIAQSCDECFYDLARRAGPNEVAKYARTYGLGERTGVDLPNEGSGVVPDPAWKKRVWKQDWYGGDTLNMGIGQGFVLTTPLQIARMMAAVANGGTLVTPHLVTEIRSLDGRVVARIAPPPGGHIQVTPQTLDVLRTGLAAVVSRGTGTALQMPGFTAAGKTGTAEASHGKPYAWFAAYAPVDAPRLVVVAMVENAGFGAENALPVVKQVFQAWLAEQNGAAPATPAAAAPPQTGGPRTAPGSRAAAPVPAGPAPLPVAPSGGSPSAPAPKPAQVPAAGPEPAAPPGLRESGRQ